MPPRLRTRRTRRRRASARCSIPAAPRTTICLTIWSPGATNSANAKSRDPIHAGIYLIKNGKPIWEPGAMLLDQARCRSTTRNGRGRWSPTSASTASTEPAVCRPCATTASSRPTCRKARPSAWSALRVLYKRESFPKGVVPAGSVTATGDPQGRLRVRQRPGLAGPGRRRRPLCQQRHPRHPHPGHGAAIDPRGRQVLQLRQRTAAHPRRDSGAQVHQATGASATGVQPTDPDGNPDTSFLAKIPADVALHLPDARQGRHGAEHGPDLASAAARRSPQQLRRLPCPQPAADSVREDRRGQARLCRSGT